MARLESYLKTNRKTPILSRIWIGASPLVGLLPSSRRIGHGCCSATVRWESLLAQKALRRQRGVVPCSVVVVNEVSVDVIGVVNGSHDSGSIPPGIESRTRSSIGNPGHCKALQCFTGWTLPAPLPSPGGATHFALRAYLSRG